MVYVKKNIPKSKIIKKYNLVKSKKINGNQKVTQKKIPKIKNLKKNPNLIFSKIPINPIISPDPNNNWESWQTFNPAAILLNNNIHFLYRAIGDDGQSRLGYAMSEDGFKIKERLKYPVYKHPVTFQKKIYNYCSGGSWGGCEDPRLIKVSDEDRIYLLYTACDGGIGVAISSIKVDDFLNKRWIWKKPILLSEPGKWNKNWTLFPEKIKGKYAILHSITPEILIDYFDDLEFKNISFIKSHYDPFSLETDRWDQRVRAIGPPPIKTKYGWLVFYHAEDQYDPGKYKLGVMLLDLKNPKKILYRCKHPVLEPKEAYEFEGFKPGIVYALGAVIKDENLIIYYGGADNFVCVAYINYNCFLDALIKGEKKKFKIKVLKKKKK
jgi:beta-1,2-mannobiose phosphorylase / 1,2-beta-oligomannan phosphorylase